MRQILRLCKEVPVIMKMGMQELLVILIIVLIIFGPRQIPKLSHMFGRSVKSARIKADKEEKKEAAAEAVEKMKETSGTVSESAGHAENGNV